MLYEWLEATDGTGSCVRISALLDYRKAFDSVDHKLLIAKLFSLGIGPTVVNWLIDFRSDLTTYAYFLEWKSAFFTWSGQNFSLL